MEGRILAVNDSVEFCHGAKGTLEAEGCRRRPTSGAPWAIGAARADSFYVILIGIVMGGHGGVRWFTDTERLAIPRRDDRARGLRRLGKTAGCAGLPAGDRRDRSGREVHRP